MREKSKLIKTIILVLIVLVIGILAFLGLYYPLINSTALFEQIKQDYNNSAEIVTTGDRLAKYSEGYSFEKFAQKFYSGYDFIITDPNPLFPIITITFDEHENATELNILKLQRSGLNSFMYTAQIGGEIRNKSYEEAKSIVQKYDLTKENPDPANIVIYPSPTKADVERRNETEQEFKIKENLRTKYFDKLFLPTLNREEKRAIATGFLNQYKTAETQITQNPDATVIVIESSCTPKFRSCSTLRLCQIDIMIDELQTGIVKLERGDDAFVITDEYLKQINYFNVAR